MGKATSMNWPALHLHAAPDPHSLGSWRLGLHNYPGIFLDFLENTIISWGSKGPFPWPTRPPPVDKGGTKGWEYQPRRQ